MFEDRGLLGAGPPAPRTAKAVHDFRAALAGMDALDGGLDDGEAVEQIRALEELKAAAAAAQARVSAGLYASVSAAGAARGVPVAERGRGVAAQVALARRESPSRGSRYLGLARALTAEMPHTLAALTCGRLSEWRATLLVRETACLSVEDRRRVDAELCADPGTLDGLGDRGLVAAAKRVAYRLDPHAVVDRARRAQSERRISVRPAPDTMAYLTALLPVAQAVACYAALGRAADALVAYGDPRTRAQLMADLAVERMTGQSRADGVPVTVNLVMTERALFAGDGEPAFVPGYGPVPAGLARDLLRPPTPARTYVDACARAARAAGAAADAGGDATATPGAKTAKAAVVLLRRLFTHPSTGELVAMESRARAFPDALREFLVLRDQTCRTPWCDAPVRHGDHVVPRAKDGPTSAANGQGLCEACNYTKEAPGWTARPTPGSRPGAHEVEITTPTGHRYRSRPPPQPGTPDESPPSRIELYFADYLHAA
jgi:hypothetical protein